MTITLLGTRIDAADDFVEVEDLRFLKDNPRVYACTHGEVGFNQLTREEQQERIFKKLLEEPSVKNLAPEIKRHGGLIEPILIRRDTMEVIEGNSRLAVYRKLRDDEAKGEWDLIPCNIISSLTDDQQFAFLNQVHVKGKTQWSAYEKANFAYVRKAQGWDVARIAELFGEHVNTIRTRIRSIELMRENEDGELSHFSHYDVLVRGPGLLKSLDDRPEVRNRVMEDLRNIPSPEQRDDGQRAVTAQELRRLFPALLNKKRVLNRYIRGSIGLYDACRQSEISPLEEKVKQAIEAVDDITKTEVRRLDRQRFMALRQQVNKLARTTARAVQLLEEIAKSRAEKNPTN